MDQHLLIAGERYRIADVRPNSVKYVRRGELIGEEVIFHGFGLSVATKDRGKPVRLEPLTDNARRILTGDWESRSAGGYYITLEPIITDTIPALASPEEELAWAEEDMKEEG